MFLFRLDFVQSLIEEEKNIIKIFTKTNVHLMHKYVRWLKKNYGVALVHEKAFRDLGFGCAYSVPEKSFAGSLN